MSFMFIILGMFGVWVAFSYFSRNRTREDESASGVSDSGVFIVDSDYDSGDYDGDDSGGDDGGGDSGGDGGGDSGGDGGGGD